MYTVSRTTPTAQVSIYVFCRGSVYDQSYIPRGDCHWHMVVSTWSVCHPEDCAQHLCTQKATARIRTSNLIILSCVEEHSSCRRRRLKVGLRKARHRACRCSRIMHSAFWFPHGSKPERITDMRACDLPQSTTQVSIRDPLGLLGP